MADTRTQKYTDEFRALKEAQIRELRELASSDDANRIYAAMLRTYSDMWEFILSGQANNLSDGDQGKLWKQVNGLEAWLPWEEKESIEVSKMRLRDIQRDVGYSASESVKLLPKGKRGRPHPQKTAITALEMHLKGFTDPKIADELCDNPKHRPHKNGTGWEDPCVGLFRKQRGSLKHFLESCGFQKADLTRK